MAVCGDNAHATTLSCISDPDAWTIGGYKYASSARRTPWIPRAWTRWLGDIERLLTDTSELYQQSAVLEQLARLEDAPLITGDAARIKVAALLVAAGRWDDLVEVVEFGLSGWPSRAEELSRAGRLGRADSALHAPVAEFDGVEFYPDLARMALPCTNRERMA